MTIRNYLVVFKMVPFILPTSVLNKHVLSRFCESCNLGEVRLFYFPPFQPEITTWDGMGAIPRRRATNKRIRWKAIISIFETWRNTYYSFRLAHPAASPFPILWRYALIMMSAKAGWVPFESVFSGENRLHTASFSHLRTSLPECYSWPLPAKQSNYAT